MATKIVTKNSSTASAVPTTGDLVQGELAVNVADKRLFTEDNGGSIVELGTNPSGDVTFQDNGKAIFGAGSDLQIYHDGSHSYIDDVGGTGNLKIRATNLVLQSAIDENYATFVANGAASLFYDNALKLATTSTGIDVTGTATMDGLTVDGDITVSDISPSISLMESDTTNLNTFLASTAGDFSIYTRTDAGVNSKQRFNLDHATGDISFYEDTGTTPKFFWDASAESLGIGTSSPTVPLHVEKDQGSGYIAAFRSNNSSPYITLQTTGGITQLQGINSSFTDVNNIAMQTSGGNVGIGTSSPATKLEAKGNTASGSDSEIVRITSTDSVSRMVLANSVGQGGIDTNGDSIRFTNTSSNTERMRIDSNGALLLGNTSPISSATKLSVNQTSNGSYTAPLTAFGGGVGYTLMTWLDGTAAYIGQNSTIRALRMFSGSGSAGVNLANAATSWGTFSDERLKENIEPIENALDSLSGLRTVKYHLKDVDGSGDKKKLGLIAQDLVGVLDEIIDPLKRQDDETEYMSVRYTEIIPVLIKAIQEQQTLIESLTSRIAALEE